MGRGEELLEALIQYYHTRKSDVDRGKNSGASAGKTEGTAASVEEEGYTKHSKKNGEGTLLRKGGK